MVRDFAAEKKRQRLIKMVRTFFEQRGFREVVTPFLSTGAPLEPTIYPFVTTWTGITPPHPLYLPVSPEREMKILLASGASEIFTIGHCFRNLEGTGTWHHPEFLMLEWYRVNADYQQIIADTQALIAFCHRKFKPQAPALLWQTLSVEQLWQEKFGLSLAQVQAPAKLKRVARQHGYDDAGNWEQIFNQLFLNEIETAFPSTPFILSDFPARLSPLCAPKKKQPWLAERFEVYLQGREIGNGNTEQLDVASIRRLFQAEQQARLRRGQKPQPVDEEMLAAIRTLAHTGKTYAGMGLGIDRLALVLAELDDINQLWPRF